MCILGDLLDTKNAIHTWELPADELWRIVFYHLRNASVWDWDLTFAISIFF